MDDLTSRDDEKGRAMAREQGRQEEQNLQKERELAAEKGRKQGLEEARTKENTRDNSRDDEKGRELATEKGRKQGRDEERGREKPQKSGGSGLKILFYLICIVIIAAVIAILTLSVSVTNVTPGNTLPFTTNYGVTFPEGQSIAIGTSHISVLSFENELISDIDGDRQKLVVGEDRVITERRAVITTLGVVRLMDTNFAINLKYKGNRDNLAYFDMAVHTSQQVPDILLRKVLPAEIHATPI
jgi:hypothetical protein